MGGEIVGMGRKGVWIGGWVPTRPRPRAPQPYDAKTHPLLWQHPTKKQTLLEFAARANLNAQAPGARPPHHYPPSVADGATRAAL